TEDLEQPAEQAHLPQRVLAHVPQPPAGDPRHQDEVDERAVNRREDEGARSRDVLGALDRLPQVDAAERDEDVADDAVGNHNRAAISSTTSSTLRPVVSMTTAPSATASGEVGRVESMRSRRAMSDAIAPTSSAATSVAR